MRASPLFPFLLSALSASAAAQVQAAQAPPLTAEAIMARVAANQDRTEAGRAKFVYVQHAKVQSRKGKNVMCEEITDTRVTPLPKGQQQTLLSLTGHVRDNGRVIHYTAIPPSRAQGKDGQSADGDISVGIGDNETVLDADANNAPVRVKDTDIDLVENMRHNFTSDRSSKDGVNAGLFPLSSTRQAAMAFDLKGREPKNGHDTYHIVFHPKDKSDYDWKGDAWIDAAAFQPVVIRTALSRSLPLGVRALLGTNIPGLGFTVIYGPQADDLWFPSSFGTEFKIKVLFFFERQIVISVENLAFEQTHVTSTLHGEEAGPVTTPEPHP